jgi:hypothetical protein
MDLLFQLTSVGLSLCLLFACIYMVQQVRKAMEQFQKFEKLFRALREANTKARFMATSVNDKVAFQETVLQDLQAQIDILLHTSHNPSKTEVKNGDDNVNSANSANSVGNR